ncbi:hypothetical protein CRENBAI_008794 [Crenichthys baileyi]|uniref:Uncharacterized protein n=1 Tax=Crenichthys baileyi TaxID=28760 RepID=A0AAV9RKF4_9TELE
MLPTSNRVVVLQTSCIVGKVCPEAWFCAPDRQTKQRFHPPIPPDTHRQFALPRSLANHSLRPDKLAYRPASTLSLGRRKNC